MEAHKEKREEVKKEEQMKTGSENSNKEEKGDTVSKRVTGGDKERAETPHDILAFSRSFCKIDSSLE
ncbi:hypothetical protein PHAVU_009G234800 [Phaseolus vulgaris]|uniref:Uncharacterized protein n=1 Tax=Phaseolus vulgaris TaxID=3885 RepID=V7B2R8_PHAVU|nr:hypothetical protein PHAVU_009G234800g [Phaseolus vulgaris]ESW10751.1 hypothetical protein PHAVU_009G234800g [Phaseolus vulgaris]